ncbi:hypothetical protein [Brevifollis gellanilyticus]|uniref:Uncharacterized protein n=1 Tax=Brevifollis gellanilyticus TaxID=748831 RepID=A0A512M8L6_9BACT|nr:hypothetical protein [Brevifollis gellanilyticus]GEP43088.1 hypothetical protein BGE01nite_23790 [Brevifollis gellanilyticus]
MTTEQFRRELDTAEGFISLGMLEEAVNVLEDLPSQLKVTTEVISLHIAILVRAGSYLKASYLAETLSFSEPGSLEKALDVASYRNTASAPKEALEWLESIRKRWEGEAGFHYCLAQCHSALGNAEQMKAELKTACDLDEELKMKAAYDPAFEEIFGAESRLKTLGPRPLEL